jgi:hypothetical protein
MGVLTQRVPDWGRGRGALELRVPPPAELSHPRQTFKVVSAGPYAEPAVAFGAEPPTRPRRRLPAVRRLQLVSVDHPGAPPRLGDEAGGGVAGLGHTVHGGEGRPSRYAERPLDWVEGPLAPVSRD